MPGRALLRRLGLPAGPVAVAMDRAYEGATTRQLALALGFTPWTYNRELYKWRNEVERLFRRLKGFRRIFSRFDKLDALSGGSC